MSGHGWVTPNPDGSKARCGGPAICPKCAVEANAARSLPVLSDADVERIADRVIKKIAQRQRVS